MDWPLYYSERLKIGNPKSPVAILTLWDEPEAVVKKLDPKLYAVAGALRSRRGISFLLRNILARPTIRYLLICGRDLGGVKEELYWLFRQKEAARFTDEELPLRAVKKVIEGVELRELSERPTAVELKEAILKLKPKPPFARPRVFPLPKVPPTKTFPTDLSLFKIRAETVGEAWLTLLKIILKFGLNTQKIGARPVRAALNLAAVVEEEDPDSPKIGPYFPFGRRELKKYLNACFNPRGRGGVEGEAYTYGERLRDFRGVDQFRLMVEKLKSFPPHEGAVAVLWDVERDNFPPRRAAVRKDGKTESWNVPCLNLLQAIVIEGWLFLTAYFRANDMYEGWPFNAFALRKLQKDLAAAVGFKMGSLTTISHWAWVDKNALGEVERIVSRYYGRRPELKLDPRGNFLVEVAGNEIVVTHLSPEGGVLAQFREDGRRPKAAARLYRKLVSELALSQVDHALYLGGQIAKAEVAVRRGLKFEQDKIGL